MDYYYELDNVIKEEIDSGQQIAIYPMGKVGLRANEILAERYGRNAYKIDNYMAQYNSQIYSLDDFQKIDNECISIIVCLASRFRSNEFVKELKDRKVKAKVRIIMETLLSNSPEKRDYFKRVKDLCNVKECLGYELVRVGGEYDGGYVMPNDFGGSIAYSFGIGGDISWDKWVANQGFKVYCFDHTIDKLPEEYEGCFFEKKGISGTDCEEDNLFSIDTILQQNGHENQKNMILKMDVEGAEWDFLENVSTEILDKFSLMTFELHGLTQTENETRILNILEKINKTHQVVWIHANNCGEVVCAGNLSMPSLLEITYANRKKYQFKDIVYNAPTNLDYPNLSEYPDVELKNW